MYRLIVKLNTRFPDQIDLFTQYTDKRYWSFTDSSQPKNRLIRVKCFRGKIWNVISLAAKNCGHPFTDYLGYTIHMKISNLNQYESPLADFFTKYTEARISSLRHEIWYQMCIWITRNIKEPHDDLDRLDN